MRPNGPGHKKETRVFFQHITRVLSEQSLTLDRMDRALQVLIAAHPDRTVRLAAMKAAEMDPSEDSPTGMLSEYAATEQKSS